MNSNSKNHNKFFFLLLSMLVCSIGNVWGEYFALADQGTNSVTLMNSLSKASSKSYTLSAPGKTLTFELEKTSSLATGDFTIQAGGQTVKTISISDLSKNKWKSYTVDLTAFDNYKTNRTITFSANGTLTKYLRSAKVTMAQYIENPSSTATMAWGAGKVDDNNVTKSVTIAWCNVPAFTTSLSGTGTENVSVSISNNASAGKYGTATVNVTYNRNTASTLNATLTIANSIGEYSQTIALTGSTTQYSQSLSWNNEASMELNMLEGSTQDVTATATSGLTIFYSSSNPSVLSVDASGRLTAHAVGSATITVSQAGNYKYSAAAAISKTFAVKSKDTPVFTLHGASADATEADLLVGETLQIDLSHVSDGNGISGNFTVTPDDNGNYISWTRNGNAGASITVTATHAGTMHLTLHQAVTSAIFEGSRTFTIRVSKHTTALTIQAPTNMTVGQVISTPYTTNNTAIEVAFSASPAGVLTMENGQLKALAAGTTTITYTQPTNDQWTMATESKTITVSKNEPVLTWNADATSDWNHTISNPFTTSNQQTTLTCVSSDEAVAKYDPATHKIYVYNTNGTATFTLEQAENDYWAYKKETHTLTVTKGNRRVPLTVTNSNHTQVEQSLTSNTHWNSDGYQMGEGGWTTKTNSVVIAFTGVPDKLSFTKTLSKSMGQLPGKNQCNCTVYQSADGSNWSECWSHDERVESTPVSNHQVKPDTRYLKFQYAGSVYGNYSQIAITERREVKAHSTSTIDFGTCLMSAEVPTATAYIDWYNVLPLQVSLTGKDAEQFEVVTHTVAAALDSYAENVPVQVRYKHTAAGTHTANLVISNGTESTSITLIAKTDKQTPVITWKENLSPMQVNETVAHVASAGVATVHYQSMDENYLTVDNTTGTITAIHPTMEGGVTLKAYVEEDETWNYAEVTCTIDITNLQKQFITWNDRLSRKFTSSETITLTAVSDADLPITYTLTGSGDYATIDGNQLTIHGIGNSLYLTAAQLGNSTYYPTSVTKHLVIRDPNAACGKVLLAEDYSEHTLTTGISSFEGEWTEIVWNTSDGEPGLLSCEIKAGSFAQGKMRVDEYYDDSWHEVQSYSVSTSYAKKENIQINRKASKVRVGAPVGCTLSHYVKNIELQQAKYAEISTSAIDFGDITSGTAPSQQFTIHYSNLNNALILTMEKEGTQYSVDQEAVGDECGEFGTATIRVTYNAASLRENETNTLNISNSEYNYAIALHANVVKMAQYITWEPSTLDLQTTDHIQCSATTSAEAQGLKVSYSIPEAQQEVATVDAVTGVLTIVKDGQVTVTASQTGNDQISAATPVSKTFTIHKVSPVLTAVPTTEEVLLPATLGSIALNGGAANVEGSWAWSEPETMVTEGTHAYAVTFSPANTNWYLPATSATEVTANKQPQTLTWNYEDLQTLPCSAPVIFDAVASSGLKVTYSTSDASIATVSAEGKLMVLNGGTVTIYADQSGNEIYQAAPQLHKTLTLVKGTPIITAVPQAAPIYVQQPLSESGLSNGVAQLEQVTAEGLWSWETPDELPTAGTHEYTVVFTPANTNFYNATTCLVSVTVNRYAQEMSWSLHPATMYATDETITLQATSNSETPITYTISEGGDNASIDAATGLLTMIRPGDVTICASQAATDYYDAASITHHLHIINDLPNIFVGEGDWDSPSNWSTGALPEDAEPDVVVTGNLTLDGAYTMGKLTIAGGATVCLTDAAHLTLLDDSEVRAQYGTLILSSSFDAHRSSQITGAEHLCCGEVFIDITLGDDANPNKWHAFTVPFAVDAVNGIYKTDNTRMTNERDYAIMDYHGDVRAQGKYGWKKYRGILQPGTFYLLTVNGDIQTFRFRKTANSALVAGNTLTVYEYPSTTGKNDNGWNGIGNPQLVYGRVAVPVQVLDPESYTFVTKPANSTSFMVGTPFFYQAPSTGSVMMEASEAGETYIARRAGREKPIEEIDIRLSSHAYTDHLYVSASDEALPVYETGRDLAKMTMTATPAVPQIAAQAYGDRLSMANLPMRNDEAEVLLLLYAPQKGEYTLSAAQMDGATVYLTSQGQIVWNLTEGAFTIDLARGENEGYGLLIQRAHGITTDESAEEAYPAQQTEKIIRHGQLYILHDGKVYDAQGRRE